MKENKLQKKNKIVRKQYFYVKLSMTVNLFIKMCFYLTTLQQNINFTFIILKSPF